MTNTNLVKINHNYFSKLDIPIKLYLLGKAIFYLNGNKINFEIDFIESDIINFLKNEISNDVFVKQYNTHYSFLIKSERIVKCVKKNKNIESIENNIYKYYFYLGLFESMCIIDINKSMAMDYEPNLTFKLTANFDSLYFLEKNNIKYTKIDSIHTNDKFISIKGTEFLDFCDLIFSKVFPISNSYLKSMFLHYRNYMNINPICSFYFYKENKLAITPTKNRYSDVGYDISIISEYKKINDITSLYDTGLKIEIPFGYYYTLVPRSSISKSNYRLSNSIGVIEKSYKGNLLVALDKIISNDINTQMEIKYPFKCCQIIFYPQIYINSIECFDIDMNTSRGVGGFGSSDN